MMKRFLLICLLLPAISLGQTNLEDSKFELIRATVHFYATDTVFKDVKEYKSACTNLGDYQCLKAYSLANNLTGVDGKITKWSAEDCKTVAQLTGLKEKILKEVTGNGKEYRMKLAAYADYNKAIDSIFARATAPALHTPVNTENATDTVKKPDAPITNVPGSSSNLLTWIALLAGLGGLGVSGWLFSKLNGLKAGLKTAAANNQSSQAGDADRFATRLKGLEAQLGQKAENGQLSSLHDRLTALEGQLKEQAKQAVAAPPVATAAPADKTTVTKTLYAKFADPDGFPQDSLKSEQNGERIFEILVQGEDNAMFRISDDSRAQGYAIGSGVNHILENACTLYNQPSPNCRIHTREPGALQKVGDVWQIERKAVVEFV